MGVVDGMLCWSLKLACPGPPNLIDTTWGYVFFWMLCFADSERRPPRLSLANTLPRPAPTQS